MVKMTPRGIIGLGVAVAFLVAIVPGALTNFFAVNTTTWDTSVANLWPLIPLAIVAIFIFAFLPREGAGKGAA